MSDGSLSQEEIDALLQGADDITTTPEAPSVGGQKPLAEGGGGALTGDELNELKSLSIETAEVMGTTLGTITGNQISIGNPSVDVLNRDSLISQISGGVVQISANFTGAVSGSHSYIIPQDLAKKIAAMMMAQEEGDLTEMALSALNEAFSQMSGATLNVVEDKSSAKLKTVSVAAIKKENPSELDLPDGDFVKVGYEFESGEFKSLIEEIYSINVAKALADGMLNKKGINPNVVTQAGAQNSDIYSGIATQPSQSQGSGIGVQPVQFAPLNSTGQTTVPSNIGLLMDVSMQLTVELGRTKMLIKDILGMGEGTIVELDKLAGEPVDLLVNGKLIAKGEVVVIDENFGVRVTDIISPMDRISNLE